MEAGLYPTSYTELAAWAKRNRTRMEEARRRFVQFVILASMASSNAVGSRVAFKGGNALRFLYGSMRSTLDLDFTAEADFPDDKDEIRQFMDAALKTAERRYQVKARCQGIDRKPPRQERTRATYNIRIAFQLPGDRYYQNFAERSNFNEVIEVEISLNEILCETEERKLEPSENLPKACTLSDIIAEKLRTLLQQIPRNRNRPQEAFDIASMMRKHSSLIDFEKVSSFLIRKSEAREIFATKGAFNEDVRARAAELYESTVPPDMVGFIPFDEAWSEVLAFVARLSIPE